MSTWGKWILAAGIASFGVQAIAKPIFQPAKKQSRQLIMRVNTQTNIIEVKTPRGWMATRQVTSENEATQQEVTTEPTGWWGYRGWLGGGVSWAGAYGGYDNGGYYGNGYGYYNNGYYPSYGYSDYYGYVSPDSYYVTPYYGGGFYSGISTSYWNSYPSSYYFYTPTWTLYYGRQAYDPVNWYSRGLFNYYQYNL